MADFYLELLKYFRHLGKAIEFAFEDIAKHSQEFLNNRKLLVNLKVMKADDNCYKYMEDFIELEITQEVAFASGKNNRNLIRNDRKYGSYKNYTSTSYNFIRAAWLFDFLSELFRLMW